MAHASSVFAVCQLYLTWPARNDRGRLWILHTCQVWQVWAGCDSELEKTVITKVWERGKKQLWEKAGFWKRETKEHKMNHWKSNGRKARRWHGGEGFDWGLWGGIKTRDYMLIRTRHDDTLWVREASVQTLSGFWRSMTQINHLQWGFAVELRADWNWNRELIPEPSSGLQ